MKEVLSSELMCTLLKLAHPGSSSTVGFFATKLTLTSGFREVKFSLQAFVYPIFYRFAHRFVSGSAAVVR